DVPSNVFARWSGVENDDLCGTCALQQLVHLYGVRLRPIAEMLANEPFEIGETAFRHRANDFGQLEYVRIDQTVVHEQSFLPAVDERRLSERPKVLRCVCQRELCLSGQRTAAAFSLCQEFQTLEP